MADNSKSRNWCITVNNYADDDIKKLEAVPYKYLIIGKEIGQQGTLHLQVFLSLKTSVTFAGLRRKLAGYHIEKARGTPQQACTSKVAVVVCLFISNKPTIQYTFSMVRSKQTVNSPRTQVRFAAQQMLREMWTSDVAQFARNHRGRSNKTERICRDPAHCPASEQSVFAVSRIADGETVFCYVGLPRFIARDSPYSHTQINTT